MENKKITKESFLFYLIEIIFYVLSPLVLIFSIPILGKIIIDHSELNKVWLLMGVLFYGFIVIWAINKNISVGEKLCNKLLHIPENDFWVVADESTTIVNYTGRYEFVIRKPIRDITLKDFKTDSKGRELSFIDRERIFSNFYCYKEKRIRIHKYSQT